MKKMRIIVTAALLVLVTAGFWLYRRADASEAPAYRFAAVERGDLQATVSATGKLNAVTTVQVGTQVSGQVSAIHADFNDAVKKGELIARIDPTLQEQAVREARANVERSRAELEQAERAYERNRQLYETKVVTQSELEAVQYARSVAKANMQSAEVSLDRARRNLAYTSIHAPIDGIVVERNVDVGQTVAASLSAPQLFLIANDLSRMQILAAVDESDIGLIREGQPVQFTVQPYPNETFTGTVRQVRLQSTTTENVVNYTVVVEVSNPDGKLMPGMTATVEFVTGSATDALTVPTAALRFRPTEAMQAELGDRPGVEGAGRPDSVSAGASGAAGARTAGARRPGNAATLWYVGADGALARVRVRTGITNGQRTEVRGEGLAAGTQVIVGAAQESAEGGEGASTSPFQPQAQRGPRPPGGF